MKYLEQHFLTFSFVFITFWLSYHNLLFSSASVDKMTVKIQSWKPNISELKVGAEQRWFGVDSLWNSAIRCWNFQFWKALIQRKSGLISAGILCVFRISVQQRWKMSKLCNSDLSLRLQSGMSRTWLFNDILLELPSFTFTVLENRKHRCLRSRSSVNVTSQQSEILYSTFKFKRVASYWIMAILGVPRQGLSSLSS